MSNLVDIKIHGVLAEQLGQSEWKLNVKSVGDAIRGIQYNNKKLFKKLYENDKKNIRYRVLINNKDFAIEEGKDPDTIEGIASSELAMDLKSLKSIDIVPVIEGSDNFLAIFTIVLGVMLIAVGGAGLGLFGGTGFMGSSGALAGMGVAMGGHFGAFFLAGIGLVAAGVTSLLTPMPKFGDFREIEDGGNLSYLFNGPENTIREGGPVFVAYGRLLVGSHVIQSASDTLNVDAGVADASGNVDGKWGVNKGMGIKYNIPNAASLMNTASEDWSSTE